MTIPFTEVKAGDYLVSDGSFDCIKTGEALEVFQHKEWLTLCVRCSVGAHVLKDDEHGLLTHFSLIDKPEPRKTKF
jgi:uncharacterized SAM-dependent methyltransferase